MKNLENVVMTAGDYSVLRHEGVGRYSVWGPDHTGRHGLRSTHAKKSDACMAAVLNHEQGAHAAPVRYKWER